jgi:hypothetical protein
MRRIPAVALLAVALVASLPTGAHAKDGPVVLTNSSSAGTVHVQPGEIVQVRLTGDANAQCPYGWGPVADSNKTVLIPAGNAGSGVTATADFRAGAEGTAHLTSPEQLLPPKSSATPAVCPGALALWSQIVVVTAPSAQLPFTGDDVSVMAVVGVASIAVGAVLTMRTRRRTRRS